MSLSCPRKKHSAGDVLSNDFRPTTNTVQTFVVFVIFDPLQFSRCECRTEIH